MLRTLVVTDLVDSTSLAERLGDVRTGEVSARHDRLARDLIARHGGREIDKTDGFLLLFEHPSDAVAYALAYHRALGRLSRELELPLYARVGIHMGEVLLRENDPEDVARGAKPLEVEGLAKPMAARVSSLALGKQTLLTRGAFDLVRRHTGGELDGRELAWLAHGPYLFKGVPEPVEIFEVGVSGEAPLEVPPDSLKVRRAVAVGDELTLGWRPAPGQEIPRRAGWVLEEKLGAGGFGEVWRARHRATGEPRVFKFCYEAERLRGLKREVALFRLLKEVLGDREDIARVLDWSFEEAPYFLELEYTAGGDLTEWAEERGGIGEVPLATRLEIAAQIAEALAAAHSVGVLHKDVKPTNILVRESTGGGPQVRLTDFGIGMVMDRQLLLERRITLPGLTEMLDPESLSTGGTQLYMAPELVEGKPASVQADIYALGVLLYQMVVGDFSRALATGWRRDVEDPLLAEDLEAMVDGRPERRPGSAAEVAERLRALESRRALREAERREREEAEAARRALERAHRRRRMWGGIAAAAVVFLAVVSLLAWNAIEAREEAERRRSQAEDLIGFMLGDLREKLADINRIEILGDVGNQALAYFETLPDEDLTGEELVRRSQALTQIGEVRMAEGDLEAALDAFERARDLAEELRSARPEVADEARLARARALTQIGQVWTQRHDFDRALEATREAVRLSEELVESAPRSPEVLLGLAHSHFWLGYAHYRRGAYTEAQPHFERYREVAETLVELEPDDPRWRLELAAAHSNLASVTQHTADLETAERHMRLALDVERELVEQNPGNDLWREQLATELNKLGVILEEGGELTRALELYREDLSIRQGMSEQDPINNSLRARLATSHHFVGRALDVLGRHGEAREHYEKAVETMEQVVSESSTNTRWQRNLATHHLLLGESLKREDPEAALEHLRHASDSLLALSRSDRPPPTWRHDLAHVEHETAEALLHRGRDSEALAAARRAHDLLGSILAERPENAEAAALLAENALVLSRLAPEDAGDVRRSMERSLEILEPLGRGSSYYEILDPLARLRISLGQHERATEILHQLEKIGYRSREFVFFCEANGFAFAASTG